MAVEFSILENEELSFDIDNTALIRGPRGYSITRVEKIAGTHAAGTLDTYRVYIDNGDTDDFEVYNGKDAYTYAVAAGYEGTEAEFAELVADLAAAKVFVAEYGVTTYSELEAAYNSGKTLFAKYNDGVMPFYCKNGGAYYFTQIRQTTGLSAECMSIYLGSSGSWSYTLTKLVTYWNGNVTLDGKLTLGAAPTADMDATTKEYVDDAIASAIESAIGGSY